MKMTWYSGTGRGRNRHTTHKVRGSFLDGQTRTSIVIAAIIVVLIKGFAATTTASAVMTASFMASLRLLVASLAVRAARRVAAAPADQDHRFGHDKVLAIVSLLSPPATVFLTASVYHAAVGGAGAALTMRGVATIGIVSGIAILASLWLAFRDATATAFARKLARGVAAGAILMNLSVAASAVLSYSLGIRAIDLVVAWVIIVFVCRYAISDTLNGLDILMDREWPEDERSRLLDMIGRHTGVLGYGDLRTRFSGSRYFAQVCIQVSPDISVTAAKNIASSLAQSVSQAFHNTELFCRVEPYAGGDRCRAESGQR